MSNNPFRFLVEFPSVKKEEESHEEVQWTVGTKQKRHDDENTIEKEHNSHTLDFLTPPQPIAESTSTVQQNTNSKEIDCIKTTINMLCAKRAYLLKELQNVQLQINTYTNIVQLKLSQSLPLPNQCRPTLPSHNSEPTLSSSPLLSPLSSTNDQTTQHTENDVPVNEQLPQLNGTQKDHISHNSNDTN